MPAIFLASRMPPTRPRFICRMAAAPACSSRREIVLGRQPLAGGDWNARARAPPWPSPPGASGRHRFLEPQADRRARGGAPAGWRPAAVIWPWVPNSRSALLPTASRSWRAKRSDNSSAAERQLPAVEGGVRPDRIELERREALAQVFRGAGRREIRDPDTRRWHRPGGHRYRCRCAAARARARRAGCRPADWPPCR